ncbi:hypothetical protein A4R26_16435 [Niastella populi]|uniref:Uncharacterized protein n=2 Tax=Niastella populi TaxID=550983 RepID=A0A1V9G1Z3_9BACT|nr:hypothetical protein A4R26_16435 [Niastella populi]
MIAICLLVCTSISFSQQKQAIIEQRRPLMEQKADSAIANRTVKRMKELFSLTASQELELYNTGVTINNNRRQVFKSYWKSEAFRDQMAKVDSAADASYKAIVGVENYKLYKEVLSADVIRRQAIMQQRAGTQQKDTTTIKTTNP